MSYHGDFPLGAVFNFKFTTIDAGIPTSISGGFVAAYPDNSATEITAGLVFTSDFDSRVGLNNVQVTATSGNGYVTGSNYGLVLISGTVGGKSVVGYLIGSFSIQSRFSSGGGGSVSDPWVTTLPGSYTPGQAGHYLASRMPTGTVFVGDKTGFFLGTPQVYDRIGNTTGTTTNVQNVINPVTAGVVTGSVLGNVNGSVNNVVQPVTAGTVSDKTGYSLSSPQNFNLVGNITGTFQGNIQGNLTGSVGSLATQAKADVNAEVVDVLNVDTYGETSGVPSATATIVAKLSRLYDALINKLDSTASKKKFYNNSDVQQWEKDTTDDGTTYSETKGNAP